MTLVNHWNTRFSTIRKKTKAHLLIHFLYFVFIFAICGSSFGEIQINKIANSQNVLSTKHKSKTEKSASSQEDSNSDDIDPGDSSKEEISTLSRLVTSKLEPLEFAKSRVVTLYACLDQILIEKISERLAKVHSLNSPPSLLFS
ncbi:MAG: hypothetical protein ABIQ95_14310 [Bdellovibrionia bacterium]